MTMSIDDDGPGATSSGVCGIAWRARNVAEHLGPVVARRA